GNAFSPDGDDVNDQYTVHSAHIGRFHMLVFNRWGEVIFESSDHKYFWDGYYRGEPMPIGVYPWIITYEGDTEDYKGPYKQEGSVTIVSHLIISLSPRNQNAFSKPIFTFHFLPFMLALPFLSCQNDRYRSDRRNKMTSKAKVASDYLANQ